MKAGLLPAATAQPVIDELRDRYQDGVLDNSLHGSITAVPLLLTAPKPGFDAALLDDSFDEAVKDGLSRDEADAVIAFVKARAGTDGLQQHLARKLLASRPSIAALKGPIQALYPEYAREQLKVRITPIHLTAQGDQLFGLNLKDALGRLDNLNVMPTPEQARARVHIKELAMTIAALPPETETIRYAQYQVSFLAGALLMPDNATYQYEYTRGGYEIEYAFEVTVERNGTTQSLLLRDRRSERWAKCSGARVVNVFGGTQPASWEANADMAGRCRNGGEQRSIGDVRRGLAADLAAQIANQLDAAPKVASST